MDRFTQRSQRALELSLESAARLGHNYIGTEHLLLGLLREEEGVASKALAQRGVTIQKVLDYIAAHIGLGEPCQTLATDMTPRVKRVLENSGYEAANSGSGYIGTEHILAALLKEQGCKALEILDSIGADPATVYSELSSAAKSKEEQGNSAPLSDYGRDLTELAKNGKLDPVIGRDKEIDRVIQILSRRTKNNPCLIGEPGVGKTAVAEGLALKIHSGDIPENLKDKTVFALDLAAMIAGAKYRGEFEERLKNLMNDITKRKNVILFIDELHTIVGAGASEGAVDAANILKPSLARGEIQVVGATTIDEYRKYIEKDAALERRFQSVTVGEPTQEEALLILKGLRDRYEAHHKVKITDEALQEAVKLSARYITDRYLPDKAIDLMDEAASRVRLRVLTPPQELKDAQDRLADLKKEKEEAVKNQEFERAAVIRDEEKALEEKAAALRKQWQAQSGGEQKTVEGKDIAAVVSEWMNIPVSKITESESERLLKLEDTLHSRVIGQNDAVSAVARAIRRSRVGLKDPKRPIGSFLFMGPTGVGKTELSKALAQSMFGSEDALIRVDMSEYMEKHSVSRLVGSPPGYVGYDDAGQLTEKVRRNPYSIILFDEIEKAHPDVFNIMLQILDDGILTDSHGKRVDFKNTVIIMTSNIGARAITEKQRSLGFADPSVSFERKQEEIKDKVMGELKGAFRPEFLNRIDDIIVFRQLTKEDIGKIASLMLSEVKKRMAQLGVEISFTQKAKEYVVKEGYDEVYGARPLKRVIQTRIEDKIAELLLANGQTAAVTVDANENGIVLS